LISMVAAPVNHKFRMWKKSIHLYFKIKYIIFFAIVGINCLNYTDSKNYNRDYFSSFILQQPLTEIKPELLHNGEGYLIPASAVTGSEDRPYVFILIEEKGTIFFKSIDVKVIEKIDSNIVAANLTPGDKILTKPAETLNYLRKVLPDVLKKRFIKREPTRLQYTPPGY